MSDQDEPEKHTSKKGSRASMHVQQLNAPENIKWESRSGVNRSRVAKCYKAGKLTANPFLNFLRVIRKQNCGKSLTNISKIAGTMWKGMSTDQKEPFYKQASQMRKIRKRRRPNLNRKRKTLPEARK